MSFGGLLTVGLICTLPIALAMLVVGLRAARITATASTQLEQAASSMVGQAEQMKNVATQIGNGSYESAMTQVASLTEEVRQLKAVQLAALTEEVRQLRAELQGKSRS